MRAKPPAFEQTGDTMHVGQGDVGRIAGSDYRMGIVQVVVANGHRVRRQTVGDHDRTWHHAVKKKFAERQRLSIGNDTQAASAEALRAEYLNGYRDEYLALCAASPLSGSRSTRHPSAASTVPVSGSRPGRTIAARNR